MEPQFEIIYAHSKFREQADRFPEKYELKNIITASDPGYSKRDLKKAEQRTCLFCGKSYPDANFKNLSHLVSKFIGNSGMYSDFECDGCNSEFSDLEYNLGELLGLSRTIAGFGIKKKTPGFVGRRLRAKSRSFIGEDILIIAPEDREREGNKITIRNIKNAFVPSKAYKALLKSALSLLGPDVVRQHYMHAIGYLKGKFHLQTGAFLGGYQFRVNFPLHFYLFEKKERTEKIPTHIFTLYFQGNSFTLPLPFHNEDLPFIQSADEFPLPPPFFINEEDLAASTPVPFTRDLSSNEKITDEEETFTMIMDAEEMKNSWSYDLNTDEMAQRDFNPGPTKYLIITREGFTVDPKEFADFIRKLEQDL